MWVAWCHSSSIATQQQQQSEADRRTYAHYCVYVCRSLTGKERYFDIFRFESTKGQPVSIDQHPRKSLRAWVIWQSRAWLESSVLHWGYSSFLVPLISFSMQRKEWRRILFSQRFGVTPTSFPYSLLLFWFTSVNLSNSRSEKGKLITASYR